MAVPLRPDQLSTPPPVAWISMAGRRLLWTLQGPLSSSIFVLPEDCNPDGARDLLYRQTRTEATWHPIAQEPMTQTPVASLTVIEQHLDDWQDEWYTINQEGFDEDVQPDTGDFPPEFDPLIVRASSRDYVTVQDFVSAVHPWLMERREDVQRAMNVADEEYTPPTDVRLLVSATRPEELSVKDEAEWMSALRWNYERQQQQQQ
ncbi:hypothetical protein F5B22DRAFT_594696 [Xylaria bambusicola]|uniref:uncharacterized protein n=1 Tax=Xylaria bambusicola TaxID=326684 RepID=UPI0020079F63|nr:uncharacterized protein F5B22DRAFT_594696 [Xylaria bambusicola]KAI0521919.1 hypothetical protein F5B22DRAFT_594696 [Xylaria bambusicola]